ncbi:MAG: LysR family transcriptional regulator [Deltaproteobacteria bacterium]|nr:MAG: LysR family transcriptional regulator [Deltaproteobacteria bacterium]
MVSSCASRREYGPPFLFGPSEYLEHNCSVSWYKRETMNLPVDNESLRCFLRAAERLHFREAAEQIGLSPPAFSDRIRRLEEDLGAQLFERTTRRITLTPAGARLVPAARRTLEAADLCRRVVRASADPLPYALTLGSRFELAMSWLVPALPALAQAVPARTIHLALSTGADLLSRTERGMIDAMISSQRLSSAAVDDAPLHEERYALVGSPSLIADRPLDEPSHAAAHTLLDTTSELPLFRYFRDAHPRGEVWAFGRMQFLGGIGPIRSLVLQGLGVAVLPRYYIEPDLCEGRLTVLQPQVELASDLFRMVFRRGHPRTEALRQLAEELRAYPLR